MSDMEADLNDDGMDFGEVVFREPGPVVRPDRDTEFACLAYRKPEAADLPVFFDRLAADQIERHALSDTSVELGGILLGKECQDPQTRIPFVWIRHAIEARHYENTQASFTYTHESWEEINRLRSEQYPDLDIVGWYHTHPDFGVFLSSHDLFIQRNYFSQPLQVAYVVDPIRQTRSFFVWRASEIVEISGFHVVAPRDQRVALARTLNDLEQIEDRSSGAGGHGLSPLLEAELVAMLSSTRQAALRGPLPDRSAGSALNALIGLVLGLLIALAGFGFYSIETKLEGQTKQLQAVTARLEDQSGNQALLLGLLESAELDGKDPRIFLREYRIQAEEAMKMSRAVDQFRKTTDALSERLSEMKSERDEANQEIIRLEQSLETAEQNSEKLSKLIEELKGEKDDDFMSPHALYQILAIAGGIISLILGGAVGYLLYRNRIDLPGSTS